MVSPGVEIWNVERVVVASISDVDTNGPILMVQESYVESAKFHTHQCLNNGDDAELKL